MNIYSVVLVAALFYLDYNYISWLIDWLIDWLIPAYLLFDIILNAAKAVVSSVTHLYVRLTNPAFISCCYISHL